MIGQERKTIMTRPTDYSFIRYLTAKKSVDDRALNCHVFEALSAAIEQRGQQPLRVLEVGAGIGTMVQRLSEWKLLNSGTAVTILDSDPGNIHEAHRRLSPLDLNLELQVIDVFDFMAGVQNSRSWDLLIAHAFLDLVDAPTILPLLRRLAEPAGLFYFTVNFDGVTILEPIIDPDLDALIEHLYHQAMDRRMVSGKPSGESRTGRHLFHNLARIGYDILDAGSSDWVVFPKNGRYPHDEEYFLHFIIHTIGEALGQSPELDGADLDRWVSQRHEQIERGELVYVAHQIDILAARAG